MPRRTKPTQIDHQYHHGDLRRALVAAGLVVAERDGIEGLSLRAVALEARVSHGAPYHHFKSKAELLAAVASAGFERLVGNIMEQFGPRPPANPVDRLLCIGRGYVRFALTNPSLFRLMFRPELTQPSRHAELMEAESRTFNVLLETIRAMQAEGLIPGRHPGAPAAFAWSTVHGLATLKIEDVFNETPLGTIPFEQIENTIHQAIVKGLEAFEW